MYVINAVGFRNELCTDFNGVDNYAYVDNPTFRGDEVGAVLMRVRRLSEFSANGQNTFCGMGHRNGEAWTSSRIELRVARSSSGHGPGVPSIFTHNGSIGGNRTVQTNIAAAQLPQNVWRNLAWVQDGEACAFYVDGVSRASTTGSISDRGLWWANCGGDTVRFTLGCAWYASGSNPNGFASMYCDTVIDEVVVLGNVVPVTSDIQRYTGSGSVRNPYRIWSSPYIRAWYRMGDSRDDPTTIYDATGNGNNLALVNMDEQNYIPIP